MNRDPGKLKLLGISEARLFLQGFLTLFLELLFIRYLAGNIWNLGYFPNLVLLAVFIGMGVGFLFHGKFTEAGSQVLYIGSALAVPVMVLLVAYVHPGMPGFSAWSADLGGDLYFTATPPGIEVGTWVAFPIWFLLLVTIFALISQRTAKLFRRFPPLTAYTLDILGSCAGILLFIVVSWLQIPAYVWFLVLIPAYLLVSERTLICRALLLFVPLVLTALFVLSRDRSVLVEADYRQSREVVWSPYQKVEYRGGDIFVNGIAHQVMSEPSRIARDFYQIPYSTRDKRPDVGPYRKVLILGSGAGNDVVAALLNNVDRVDAVEIDPGIADLGKIYHPGRPYADPRVNLIIDDGRAFMTRTEERYDLVIFALTDSLVKVSAMTQLRLENYLFTKEAVARAYELLEPDGDLVFYNHYRRHWLLRKLASLIYAATGHVPVPLYNVADFVILRVSREARTAPGTLGLEPVPDLPTDDWPFLYLRERGIPGVYLASMIGLIVMVTGVMFLVHWRGPHRQGREAGIADLPTKLAFLLMGMAFLLLETKSVVQFSLLFGTTWMNSSLVFLAVLGLVLAANWIALFLDRTHQWWLFGLLIASCVAAFCYPLSRLLALESVALRFVCASLFTFLPIFFANVIFSVNFKGQKVAEHVFGWNLVGATVGGVLEYMSMAIGYSALTVVVALCYALVFLLLRRARPESSVPGRSNPAAEYVGAGR